jgi:hypothetical protein
MTIVMRFTEFEPECSTSEASESAADFVENRIQQKGGFAEALEPNRRKEQMQITIAISQL